jgi:2-polyprenyl-3-methyl-5-hydroxy-6-metoxy-1,4-benzoquinol methylase
MYTSVRSESAYHDAYVTERVPATPFLARRLDRIIESFAPFRRAGTLLDVGFGAGDLLEAARRAQWSVCGVEVTAAAVERARERGIEAFHGPLAQARYPAGSFDVVIAAEILEHIVDVAELLVEIRRVLRPGGLLWATTPHGRGLSARMLGTSWSVVAPPEHVQLFSIRGMETLLERCGFKPLSIAAKG